MRSKVRAYSHQGHGPRADQQAEYISATSDSTTSLATGSRSIHKGQTVGAVTVRDQLHLLHTSYEPTSGLLGEASSLLTAALRESSGRDPKPTSAGLATRRND